MNIIQQKIKEYERLICYYERQEKLSDEEQLTLEKHRKTLSDLKVKFKGVSLMNHVCVKVFNKENRFICYLSDDAIKCESSTPVWFDSKEEAEQYLHRSIIYTDSGDYSFKIEQYVNTINKFEYISTSKKDFKLPSRGTQHSAGYDFYSPVDCIIKSNETKFISLDVKCRIKPGEVLMIVPRSRLGFKGKNHVALTNTVGIIDEDYYNNSSNEGVIGIKLHNFGSDDFKIKKNDRLIQGIFLKYDITEDDTILNSERTGGFGSTGN